MFKRVSDKVFGVLNDFDLAYCAEYSEQPSSKHCTGTTPFIAYRLLSSKPKGGHVSRYDLESVFYVLLIICCHYEGLGRSIYWEERPYIKWFTESVDVVAALKGTLILFDSGYLPIQPYFEDFRTWLDEICTVFRRGHVDFLVNGGEKDYNFATLGGKISYAKLKEVMCSFQGTPLVQRW
ncbi:hypothetical protein GYMLUDRAFT_919425 [Collybiopsis luxurians FD-317 M1]|uniref:Fungal-type protein kinase domain-containing protein n=1 Tax=Collybiopsis luxurians FD-317 M1 TaxID=944289 RepID=A0A0D0AU83_9AGAR|nr:hypothetical protein GYMLUDRAFT_919425 [Collybiopsis luxurians FD-317 M1]